MGSYSEWLGREVLSIYVFLVWDLWLIHCSIAFGLLSCFKLTASLLSSCCPPLRFSRGHGQDCLWFRKELTSPGYIVWALPKVMWTLGYLPNRISRLLFRGYIWFLITYFTLPYPGIVKVGLILFRARFMYFLLRTLPNSFFLSLFSNVDEDPTVRTDHYWWGHFEILKENMSFISMCLWYNQVLTQTWESTNKIGRADAMILHLRPVSLIFLLCQHLLIWDLIALLFFQGVLYLPAQPVHLPHSF